MRSDYTLEEWAHETTLGRAFMEATKSTMTYEEALKEMAEYRKQGHSVDISGDANDWTCTFDNVTTKATTPELAWMAAKSHRQDSGPK